APVPDYIPAGTPKNNDSLVLRATYGRHSFLLTGDVERQIEGRMLDAGAPVRADVLKVAHHGSHTSSTEEFLRAVAPVYAIISAGFENRHGPRPGDAVARLDRAGAIGLRPAPDGLIPVHPDGRPLRAEPYNGFVGSLR